MGFSMTTSHFSLSLRLETQKLLSLSLVSRNENLSTIEKQPLKSSLTLRQKQRKRRQYSSPHLAFDLLAKILPKQHTNTTTPHFQTSHRTRPFSFPPLNHHKRPPLSNPKP